ncbi:MAG: hypothetical protein WC408_06170 [Candidatus Micrarchaeia archaeon]|jgi:hypothetical protein
MDLSMGLTKRKLLFLGAFAVFAAVAEQINFAPIVGSSASYFTLFQFFGPIVAAFLGMGLGLVALAASQVVNFVLLGKAITLMNVLRLSTMFFAAYYFARIDTKKLDVLGIAVPAACMALFVLTPAGAEAWYYSLYWLIPIAVRLFGWSKNLVARSLGATFTAHAIGSVIFAYSLPYTAAQWTALVPVVAYERMMFAAGIAVSYVAFTTFLDWASRQADFSELSVERSYSLVRPARQ